MVKSLLEEVQDSKDERLGDANALQALTDICVHVAYLVGSYDKQYDVAFGMLMSLLSLQPKPKSNKQ